MISSLWFPAQTLREARGMGALANLSLEPGDKAGGLGFMLSGVSQTLKTKLSDSTWASGAARPWGQKGGGWLQGLGGGTGVTVNGGRGAVWEDENVLGMDDGDSHMTTNIQDASESRS